MAFIVALLGCAPVVFAAHLRAETKSPEDGSCVVWHSQHKSAGIVLESIMGHVKVGDRYKPKTLVCDKQTWDCAAQQCLVGEELPTSDDRAVIRGYVPLLANRPEWSRDRCKWATVSREPVSRLVSAFMYCSRDNIGDPLCGRTRLDAREATIQEFAKHWGNFLFRELMWFPDPYKEATSRADFLQSNYSCDDAPWLQFKDRLNGGDDLRTVSGRENLKVVKKHLRDGDFYDVNGILEKWNETCELFDQEFPLKGYTWDWASSGRGHHTSDSYKDEELALLEQARKDPIVLKELEADLALYSIVADRFERRLLHLRAEPLRLRTLYELDEDFLSKA